MSKKAILDDVVRNIPLDNLPIHYISMIKLKTADGNQQILQGDDVVRFLAAPLNFKYSEARMVINVKLIRETIIAEVESIYAEVDRRQEARFQ